MWRLPLQSVESHVVDKARPILIGVAGGTGSGKTLLTTAVAARYARLGVCIIDQDSYYHDQSHLSLEERNRLNFDQASAIDHDLLFGHLQQLLAGQAIEKPRYDFATHTRRPENDGVSPQPIIFLEGLFALWDSKCRSLMDLKVYVEADADIRFIRRLRRDILERGRTVESVVEQYLTTVRPMHQLYVEPTRAHADLIVDNTDSVEPAVAAVERAIRELRPSFSPGNGEKAQA
jgi:uridine kinase